MTPRLFYWAAALAASLIVHAGALALWRVNADPLQLAGGGTIIALDLGDAPQTGLAAGAPTQTDSQDTETAAQSPQTTEPATPKTPTAEPEPIPQAPLRRPAPEPETANPAQEQAQIPTPPRDQPPEPTQAEADPAMSQPKSTHSLEPAPTLKTPPTPEPTTPAEPAIQPVENEVIPSEDTKTVPNTPFPAPRPTDLMEKRANAQPQRKPAPTAKKTKSGAGGTSNGSAQAGGSTRRNTNAKEAGTAAISSYPGKIYRRLARATRYPPAARANRLSGKVLVGFTIVPNGGITGLQVKKTSGHAVLDAAALAAVRRAAPFPPLPQGRRQWLFAVPITFKP